MDPLFWPYVLTVGPLVICVLLWTLAHRPVR